MHHDFFAVRDDNSLTVAVVWGILIFLALDLLLHVALYLRGARWITLILRKEDQIMTDLNTVNQTESKIEADVQALTTAVGTATSAIQTENASIVDLRAQIAALQAGGGATPAELDALNTK